MKYVCLLPLAFLCEFIDSSFGMGYGTTLTPLLLLLGFQPLEVVPAVLFSEFITGFSAAFVHNKEKNVDFSLKSKDTSVAIVLSSFAVIGTIISTFIAVKLPPNVLKLFIGWIVVSMSVIILYTLNKQPRFSWLKISTVGTIASFNKGMSGGGYGPLVMGGQILSGVGVKNAIGITSFSEGVTCFVGLICYLLFKIDINWSLALFLMSGALLSVPFTARIVKITNEKILKKIVAIIILLLGILTLYKAIF